MIEKINEEWLKSKKAKQGLINWFEAQEETAPKQAFENFIWQHCLFNKWKE